jgi:hypothetical protein
MLHRASPAQRATGVAVLVVALQALMVTAFAWPAANIRPRELPVVVAGPAPAAEALARRLDAAEPGALQVTAVADADAADQRLRDREAYGAFVLAPGGLAGVHLASAASPTVAQLLTQVGQAAAQGRAVPVTDVVPADPDDPRSAGLAAALLPLVLTSMVAGLLLAATVRRRGARLLGLLAYAALAGLGVAAVLQHALGALPGAYVANAAVLGLAALAMAAAVAGLGSLLGGAGVALAVAAVFLLGNPLSGLTSAPGMLPRPWGAVGQLLPPGAAGTLLRSVAFFDGAGGGAAAWVLGAWAAAGLLLAVASRGRLRLPGASRGTDAADAERSPGRSPAHQPV